MHRLRLVQTHRYLAKRFYQIAQQDNCVWETLDMPLIEWLENECVFSCLVSDVLLRKEIFLQ